MMRCLVLVLVVPLLASVVGPQTFEAVTVKLSAPGAAAINPSREIPRQPDPARINYPAVSLKNVIARAYGVDPDQVSGPRWLNDDRYDIAATLPAGAAQTDIPALLRRLLADRFALAIHEQIKTRSFYALTPAPGGLKIQRVEDDNNDARLDFRADHLELQGFTMPAFAKFLTNSMGHPVVDETGITGSYDMILYASIEDLHSVLAVRTVRQLGLKLETRSGPAKFIIVDKIDKVPGGV